MPKSKSKSVKKLKKALRKVAKQVGPQDACDLLSRLVDAKVIDVSYALKLKEMNEAIDTLTSSIIGEVRK